MAFPTIPTVAAGRVLTTNQADAVSTRTFPDLSGLTKNSGDLLIAIVIGHQSAGTSGAIFSTWGGSFTEFTDQMTTSGSTMCIGAAWKISTGSETGTFTVTQDTPTGHATLILLSIPGGHNTTAPEAGTIANGTATAADPGAFNPSGWDTEDTLWISLIASGMTSGTGSWTATGTTAPANYTDRVDSNTTDNSTVGQTEGAVAFRQLNAASEDVATGGVDTSNARNSALVIAVRPATQIEHAIASDFPLGLVIDSALSPVEKVIASDFPLGLVIDTNLSPVEKVIASDFPLGLVIDTNLEVEAGAGPPASNDLLVVPAISGRGAM